MTKLSEELMIKFINNTCTDDELMALKDWLDESPENAEYLFCTERAAMLASGINRDTDSHERISRKIHQRINASQVAARKQKRRTTMRIISSIAAVIAIIVTTICMTGILNDTKMLRVIATASARTIILPDSTTVYLNKYSEIRYPAVFNGTTRNVELKGDAFFEVTHDDNTPFIVTGHFLKVVVRGTKFYFESHDSIDNSVSLIEGSVEVSTNSNDDAILLAPQQKASYDISTGMLTVSDYNESINDSWHSRIIPFENANIEQISDILHRLYGVSVQIDNHIDLSKTYSGVTIYYEDIDSTLTQLANTLPITFESIGDRIVIHPITRRH